MKMTARQLRKVLFDTNKYAVIGSEEMTNKESRDWLFDLDNQELKFNVIDNGTHLLIWR